MDRRRLQVTALVFCGGMVILAVCAHKPVLLLPRVAGGLIAAGAVYAAIRGAGDPAHLFGLRPLRRLNVPILLSVLSAGIVLGVYYRFRIGTTPVPADLSWFCAVAAAIGAAEELCYRGFVQGALMKWGPWAAIFLAAGAHAVYKSSLFLLPASGHGAIPWWLLGCTAVVGSLLGMLRLHAGGVMVPAAFHVIFDIVVYGDRTVSPWWVW